MYTSSNIPHLIFLLFCLIYVRILHHTERCMLYTDAREVPRLESVMH